MDNSTATKSRRRNIYSNFGQNLEKFAGIITTSTEYEYTVDIEERGRLADD
jgi:hypothetical protein